MSRKEDDIRAFSDALLPMAIGVSGATHGVALGLCIEMLRILLSRRVIDRSDVEALIAWAEKTLAEGEAEAGMGPKDDPEAKARRMTAPAALRAVIDALRLLRQETGRPGGTG